MATIIKPTYILLRLVDFHKLKNYIYFKKCLCFFILRISLAQSLDPVMPSAGRLKSPLLPGLCF